MSETARPLSERLGLAIEPDERLSKSRTAPGKDASATRSSGTTPKRCGSGDKTVSRRVRRRRDASRRCADAGANLPAPFALKITVAVFTHDVVVRLAILDAGRLPLDAFWKPAVSNGAYATLNVVDGVWSVERERTDAHLAGIAADEAAQAL